MAKELKFIAIIPARYASTRFPGKPLAKLGGKPVIQRSKTGEFLAKFPSALSAARALGKVTNKSTDRGAASHIAAACKGKRKTAYGCLWQYDETEG